MRSMTEGNGSAAASGPKQQSKANHINEYFTVDPQRRRAGAENEAIMGGGRSEEQ